MLRGERDCGGKRNVKRKGGFQLTRSVGSVTISSDETEEVLTISTHTLRGERDEIGLTSEEIVTNFNSHAPWGA